MIKTTVIIPYKNNPDALRRALVSVSSQTVPVSIIVIDDNSEKWWFGGENSSRTK